MAFLIFMFHSRVHVLHCSYGFLDYFVDMGAIAMTGFFLLSGYVINLTYQRKDMSSSVELNRFYYKRLISIIPLYFAYAIILVFANVLVNGKTKRKIVKIKKGDNLEDITHSDKYSGYIVDEINQFVG